MTFKALYYLGTEYLKVQVQNTLPFEYACTLRSTEEILVPVPSLSLLVEQHFITAGYGYDSVS